MTFDEAMARAEVQIDEIIRSSLERAEQSYTDGGISPEMYEPLLQQSRAELAIWRQAQLDELRRFLKHGDWDMPSIKTH
jgi:hypothetical protein